MSPQRRFSFLVVWILAFYGEIHGQKNSPPESVFSGYISVPTEVRPFKPKFNTFSPALPLVPKIAYGNPVFAGPKYQLLPLPGSGYYVSSLGFICKKELQLDRITPVAVRFRLGSLEYVNWMEQKPNARRF